MDEETIWRILVQLARGLSALHDLKIVHRDLKSANVFLFKDGKVKIGDLNVAEVAKRGSISGQVGTPNYASPEVWRELPCDEKSDIWSLGCIIYECCSLRLPFHGPQMELLKRKVTQGLYPPLANCYSHELHSAVAMMLQVDPAQRPTCDQLLSLPSVFQRFAQGRGRVHDSSLLGTIYAQSFSQAVGHLPAPRYVDVSPVRLPKLPTLTSTSATISTHMQKQHSYLRVRNVTPDPVAKSPQPARTATIERDHSAEPVRNKLISDCCDQIIGSYERSRAVLSLLKAHYPARRSHLS